VKSHDPEKAVSDLRDHLARHDKPLAFLCGAGTSCAAGSMPGDKWSPLIPAVASLTDICAKDVKAQGDSFEKAWKLIASNCHSEGQDTYVESMLSRIRMMLRAVGESDSLCGLSREQLRTLEETVRRTIAREVAPDLSALPAVFPHADLARWIARTSRSTPVEVFTVNYDILFEHALESQNVPVFDGFVGSHQPFFHADSLSREEASPAKSWTRVWKMHGSVNWSRIDSGDARSIVRGAVSDHGEMILPSFDKYDESRQQPYTAFADRLRRFLEQDDALLVVLGFSFGDDHINDLIFGALDNCPRTHVFSLQYSNVDDASQLHRRAVQRSNMIVMSPDAAIIGGRACPWDISEELVVASRLFVSNGKAGDEEKAQMVIGDFAKFCEFLVSMVKT